jgi:3D-(3,5/4)-trihydroxycyclohexane-1,2-dione acylhydrolase (decyclizing)
VIVVIGDGSYLMLNSEIATSVMLGRKLVIVVLDNRGYGCISRLQQAVGGAPFNNLLDDCGANGGKAPPIDFAAHARALGAQAEHVRGIAELEAALGRARAAKGTYVVSIDTSPSRSTAEGGCWWEVAVPAVSGRAEVAAARRQYEQDRKRQRR